MKWSFYQLLMILLIAVSMWTLESKSGKNVNQPMSGEWMPVNSSYGTFFMVSLVLILFYFIFLFEAKKEKSLLEHPVWGKMPIICIVVGVLSVILFIIGGTVGPIAEWIEQWRFLLYVFLVYFLFLVFLFIFSVEHKKQTAARKTVTTIHISLVWTLLMFLVLFFLF